MSPPTAALLEDPKDRSDKKQVDGGEKGRRQHVEVKSEKKIQT